jgi:hypothetical protein
MGEAVWSNWSLHETDTVRRMCSDARQVGKLVWVADAPENMISGKVGLD